jgi:hypothetical protein
VSATRVVLVYIFLCSFRCLRPISVQLFSGLDSPGCGCLTSVLVPTDGVSRSTIPKTTRLYWLTVFSSAPHWYSTYRFYLSIVVGFSIIATLSGTSYFGVGSGAGVPMLPTSPNVKGTEDKAKKRINKVAQKENSKVAGKQQGSVPGPIQAVDLVAEESGEGFVKVRNKEKEEEEAEKEEEEKREKVSLVRPSNLVGGGRCS